MGSQFNHCRLGCPSLRSSKRRFDSVQYMVYLGSIPETVGQFIWGRNFDGEVLPLKQREPSSSLGIPTIYATVTQLDRVPGYELGSREFESLRSHQIDCTLLLLYDIITL